MRRFIESAEGWVTAMRAALSAENREALRDCLADYARIEEWGRLLVAQMRAKGSSPRGAERELLDSLNAIGTHALVCAALAQSRLSYLQWGQSLATPPHEYTPDGTLARGERSRARWEV